MLSSAPTDAVTLVPQRNEPLLVHLPSAAATIDPPQWVVMVHALGENRVGNNYWQAQTATMLAAAGCAVIRFDLAGCGESLVAMDLDRWREQIQDAVETAQQHGARRVHVTARGLTTALLAGVRTPGRRLAVFPPDPSRLVVWPDVLHVDEADRVLARHRPAPAERYFWELCGAESNLIGGFSMPARLLADLVQAAVERANGSWELSVVTTRAPTGHNQIVGATHPLTRLEVERRGMATLLVSYILDDRGP